MKKTIIAAAMATVVAAPAMADVTVSGQLETYFNTDTESMGWDNAVKVAASEDLGNGMTISGHTYVVGKAKVTDAGVSRNETVAKLATSMGTLVLVNASDGVYEGTADAATNIAPNMSDYRPGTAHDVIAFALPKVSGVGITLFNATGDADSDLDIYKVAYANGPFSVALVDGADDSFKQLIAGTYTMGDIKVGAHSMEDAETAWAVSYKMGNNTIAMSDSDVAGEEPILAITHQMSKGTKVYFETEEDRGANIGVEMKF